MAFGRMGADVINHSIAPEATLSREIGACFVPLTFVTAGLNDYLNRDRQKVLQDHVLPNLSMTASRVALETAARLPATAECLCQDLKSPQVEERFSRF
jgi:5'-methylthioadenosine phosphorylase